MKKTLSICACAGSLAIVAAADADEYVWHPGTECMLYSGTASQDIYFTKIGNGTVTNFSGVTAKAICPVSWDALGGTVQTPQASAGNVATWELIAFGTAGWDLTKCNLFGQNLGHATAFPNSPQLSTNGGGYVSIFGDASAAPAFMGYGSLSIICSIPSANSIVQYQVRDQ